MSAQPAYSLYPERAVERAPRTRISVVPGQRTRSAAPASTVTPGRRSRRASAASQQ